MQAGAQMLRWRCGAPTPKWRPSYHIGSHHYDRQSPLAHAPGVLVLLLVFTYNYRQQQQQQQQKQEGGESSEHAAAGALADPVADPLEPPGP